MDLYELIKQGNVKHVQHFFQINPDYLLNSSKGKNFGREPTWDQMTSFNVMFSLRRDTDLFD